MRYYEKHDYRVRYKKSQCKFFNRLNAIVTSTWIILHFSSLGSILWLIKVYGNSKHQCCPATHKHTNFVPCN